MTVLDRFLKYINIATTSNEASNTCPSTPGQLELGEILVQELLDLGITDAAMDHNGYIMATIPSNIEKDAPVIGFISHLDTAPDLATVGIKPRLVEHYDGSAITLNQELDIVLSPETYPEMLNYIGQDLVVTDGLTLLGADDKAGVSEIMSMAERLMTDDSIKHGTIKIGFTPDEEIGRGADLFDVEKFAAKYAYTMDSGAIGEMEYESFNADNSVIIFNGRNVHPGYAKNVMINSLEVAQEFHAMLPSAERPQYTSDREGYFYLHHMEGSVEKTKTIYLVRDHDKVQFEERRQLIRDAVDFLNKKYGEDTVQLDSKVMYNNMGEMIEPVFEIVDLARQAMEDNGITPILKPIRGGTDGARLSFMGLPCPNLFAGGHNFHGKHEFVPVQSMEKAVDVMVSIIGKFAELDH